MTSAQNLFTKMYEAAAQAQQGAQGAADAGANQGAANDDVVDGDYKKYNFKEKVELKMDGKKRLLMKCLGMTVMLQHQK